jgi:TRAP-type mannitol/chloroaromatic compound transport system substrate-binding protein
MTHRSVLRSATAAISLAMTAADPACAGGLTLAHPYFYTESGTTIEIWAEELSACVAEVTGIYVEVIGGGKLGRPDQLANAVAEGLIDMAILPARALIDRWPELSELDQPGWVYDPQDRMKLSESQTFIETLNNMGGRDHNLELVAVGWQHAIPVGAGSGLEDLRGKKLGVSDTMTMEGLKRIGANPIPIPASKILLALDYGVVDGAIVDAEMARRGGFKELKWSPDFAPFASSVVVLMNATTAEAFGEDLPSWIRIKCLHLTHEFNARGIEEIASLARGAKVYSVSEAERELWRNALDDVRPSRLGPLVDAVRDALRQ